MSAVTQWVTLAYLNGNNELEQEVNYALKELENTSPTSGLRVAAQIGRLQQSAVKILRPGHSSEQSEEPWDGVRRYAFNSSGTAYCEELGHLNMASPACLYDFLLWGMTSFEAEHYLLLLGGHACEYIGLMNDYSQEKPYILGLPELSLVLETVKNTVGKPIDILLCDTCYFNNIEVLYELGQSSATNTVILHADSAPACGLSCRELVTAMDSFCSASSTEYLVRRLVECLSADFVAYRTSTAELEHIKEQYSRLARVYLEHRDRDFLPVLRCSEADTPGQGIAEEIARSTSSLLVAQKTPYNDPLDAIRVLDKYIPHVNTAVFYYRLAFARENLWTKLLCNRLPIRSFRFAVSVGFTPLELSKSKIHALIRSSVPALTQEDSERILGLLIDDRQWEI